jgi:23S rRNA pseudouridine1911/1915/1917 synthase
LYWYVVKIAMLRIARDFRVAIRLQTGEEARPPRQWPFDIVHADDDLLVINKPSGLLTSSVPREKRPTALAIAREWAAVHKPRSKVGLVHRLDADASGLLVFSLNNSAHATLKKQFADHAAGRIYLALVAAAVTPKSGTIRSLLVEHVDGTVHVTRNGQHGQSAVTHYETVSKQGQQTLLRVTLETGRKHQIRSHLASRGWPIMGDPLYAGAPASRLMLHGTALRLTHPRTGEPVEFNSPLPSAFEQALTPTANTSKLRSPRQSGRTPGR